MVASERQAWFLVAVASFSVTVGLRGADDCTPRVVPPHSMVDGRSLGEWGNSWWQWALSFPKGLSPPEDPNGERCHEGQPENVWFLAGTFLDDNEVVRECTVPADKHLLFPILNHFWSAEGTCEEMCQLASDQADQALTLRLTVDGVAVADDSQCTIDGEAVTSLRCHREESPRCFPIVLGVDNFFGIPPGSYGPSCSAGYWVMVEPLCPGDHVIRFDGTSGEDPKTPEFETHVTYFLTVAESPRGDACFRRGDTNRDGKVDISDVVTLLGCLFLGGECSCEDAMDSNDDGALNVTDAIYLLDFLFRGGGPPPWPGPDVCAKDSRADSLAECALP